MTISTNTEALNATALATRAIHAGQEPDPTTGAVVTPIYMTSTFKQDGVGGLRNGYDYSRSINPTRNSFDQQLAAGEGADAVALAGYAGALLPLRMRVLVTPGGPVKAADCPSTMRPSPCARARPNPPSATAPMPTENCLRPNTVWFMVKSLLL